jgi:glycosidase
MPGIPSIYYGSEWGLTGERTDTSDRVLRPALDLGQMFASAPQPDLPSAIHQLMGVRHTLPALQFGDYRQLHVDHEQFAFARHADGQIAIVAVNASDSPAQISLTDIPLSSQFEDKLNGEVISMKDGRLDLTLPPAWGRILIAC